MQGEIGVDSLPEQGSTFWLILPATTKALSATSPRLDSDTPVTSEAKAEGPQKLLYVEDNPANLRLMKRIITTTTDLQLLEATTAEEGLLIAEEQQPGLIFLDITLPGMDGYTALQHLQDNPATCHIPVIAVSANAMTHDIERGQATGFKDYIVKPFDITTITQVLSRFMP